MVEVTTMRNEDEDRNIEINGPNGIVKVVIFTMIAITIITSVVIPVLASAGIQNETLYNEGPRVGFLDSSGDMDDKPFIDDKMEDRFAPEPTPQYLLSSEGFSIYGLLEETNEMGSILLIPMSEFDTSYPMMVKGSLSYPRDSVTYTFNSNTGKFTTVALDHTTVSDTVQIDWREEYIVQYKSGEHVMSRGDMMMQKRDGPDMIYPAGIYVSEGLSFYCDGGMAIIVTYSGGETTQTYGSCDAEVSDEGEYLIMESYSYNGTECMWYFGDRYVVHEINILDDKPQINALIGVIPILILIGVVLFVARSMSKSDR